MAIHTVRFGDEGSLATRELLKRFEASIPEALGTQLHAMEAIDRKHGGAGPLPYDDASTLADSGIESAAREGHDDLVLGIALWAVRHEVPVRAVDPVSNALARRSNEARGPHELSAVFGLMQGFIAHVAPSLSPDLERSNPERAWRILHANLAITAIRSEELKLMEFAFDALDQALPDERANFYAEATALALSPRVAPAVREAIESRHRRWTQG